MSAFYADRAALCKRLYFPYMAAMSELMRLPERSVVTVNGADAETFLKGLITNGPPKEGGILAALLTPQGKILFDFFVLKAPDGYFIDVHRDAAEALVKRLTLYRLRAKVDIAIDDGLATFAYKKLAATGPNTFTNLPADTTKSRTIAPVDEFGEAEPDSDYHIHRIAAGIPEWGADYNSDEVFLMDVNFDLLDGVDYKKGCFVGQEVASRMKRKGDARKRTLIAEFDGAAPPKGAAVTAGESTLGEIMSSAGDKALALIRLDRWENAREAGHEPVSDGKALRLHIPGYFEQG